ncbi:ABC transporter permease [Oxalicibacterium flavum]|uniref:ABC transporter permease n=1 Tax=Oxalicibacterium flavum TaxID=179467 RepID=A0A8J2UKZ0_9BURK|nr:ABC transporter permease [Oxalicibacterium flavum]
MDRTRIRQALAPWLTAAGLFLLWELACRAFAVPEMILPAPSQIMRSLIQYWPVIQTEAMQTLFTTLVGFVMAIVFGVLLGVLVGASPEIYRAINPLLIGFNSIPKVAVVPVLVMWFGIGTVPAVLCAFLTAFFPIAVNVATGIAHLEPELADVLRSLGATKTIILKKVALPRALPYLFASLKVAITLAFVGSVVSEMVASNAGIGYLLLNASSSFRVPLVFAALIVVGVMGILMYGISDFIERRSTSWAKRGE